MLESHKADSHEPYWCELAGRRDAFLQCLDIASPDSMMGTFTEQVYNVSSGPIDADDFVNAGNDIMSSSQNSLVMNVNITPTGFFGVGREQGCSGLAHGDRVITAHDMTMLANWQFGTGVFAYLPQTPQLVETVEGFPEVEYMCERVKTSGCAGLGQARATHFLNLDNHGRCYDVCNPSGQRRLEALEGHATVPDMRMSRRSLSSSEYLYSNMNAKVHEWASVKSKNGGSVGKWYRIQLPKPWMSIDLNIPALSYADGIRLDFSKAPSLNDSSAYPRDERETEVRFARKLEYNNRDTSRCAFVMSALTPDMSLNKGVIGLAQQTTSIRDTLCLVDIFVYIPSDELVLETKPDTNDRRALQDSDITYSSCSVYVMAGSNAMDGLGGQIQRQNSPCHQSYNFPSPPPPPPPSPHRPQPSHPPPPREEVSRRFRFTMFVFPMSLVLLAVIMLSFQTGCLGLTRRVRIVQFKSNHTHTTSDHDHHTGPPSVSDSHSTRDSSLVMSASAVNEEVILSPRSIMVDSAVGVPRASRRLRRGVTLRTPEHRASTTPSSVDNSQNDVSSTHARQPALSQNV